MKAIVLYSVAAFAEIAGCYALWAVVRLGKSPLWLGPAVVLLVLFAALLTQTPSESAGRSFAIYGGIYIAASLVWLWAVERQRPDLWDMTGGLVCLIGAAIILWAPRPG